MNKSFLSLNLEKAMAPHSSGLAWRIPGTGEPGGPQSMGSLRVGQDSATSLSLFTFCHKCGIICISEVIDKFLLAILIPACASSSPAFLMMYSAYKLNKQGDNIQP